MSLYLVAEKFRNCDTLPVCCRFRDRGRLAPDGLTYVSSWAHESLDRCYQLMETSDRALLEEWMAHWNDIVDFEVYPLITSKLAGENIAPRLQFRFTSPARSRPDPD